MGRGDRRLECTLCSLPQVCVCACVIMCVCMCLQSVLKQTDSWSNRLRRAVGSLGSDLSPLGPLYSGQQPRVQHCFDSFVTGRNSKFICPDAPLKTFCDM